jgi:hypothetical protein
VVDAKRIWRSAHRRLQRVDVCRKLICDLAHVRN